MDEFSDFQMAVQKPAPNVGVGLPYKNGVSSGKGPGNHRFSDSSPVHSLSTHNGTNNTKAEFTTRSEMPPSLLPPVPPAQKIGTSVGSRLANYDLGLSVPTTQQQQSNGFQGNNRGLANLMGLSSNISKTINNPIIRNNNQDLLIGEEDKYSALRMLMEADMDSTTSVFENSIPVQRISETTPPQAPVRLQFYPNNTTITATTNHSTPVVPSSNLNSNLVLGDVNLTNHSSSSGNSNCTSALQMSTTLDSDSSPIGGGDSSSDFGDFQSFTGFAVEESKPNGFQSQSQPQQSSNVLKNLEIDGILGDFQSCPRQTTTTTTVLPTPIPTALPSLQKLNTSETSSETFENGMCDSDGEFGDFVSVEPVSNSHPLQSTPPSVPDASKWYHDSKTIDLSSLPMSTSPPEESKNEIQNGTMVGATQFAESIPPVKSQVAQSSSLSFELPKQKQSAAEDDINSIVLGQGLDWETSNVGIDAMKSETPKSVFLPSLNQSSFIRTSLIRNDEVTDIDPLKWSQSVVEESNNDSALDYNSFDRKDFSLINGKSKFLDVSPETRSIASLDLGSYVTVDYPDNVAPSNNNNNSKPFVDHPVLVQQQQAYAKSNGAPVTPPTMLLHNSEEPVVYDEYDKYQCFREESDNEKERFCTEWTRCLEACKTLISKAFSVFNSVSTSEVIREVVSDDKGYTYVINIFEIYRISRRIQKSAEKLGIGSKVKNFCLEINNLWETLAAFLLGTCVSTEICQDSFSDECSSESRDFWPSCGVCLCDVNISESSQFLDYGGKIYHCKCANFWVNEVDAILPSLSYVSNVASSDGVGFTSPTGNQPQVISKSEENNLL